MSDHLLHMFVLVGADLLLPDLPLAHHFARYISVVYAIERAEQILADRGMTECEPAAPVEYKAREGVGIVEAPRGLLIHYFRWDDDGYIRAAKIITPTNANVSAIDSSLKQVAARSICSGLRSRKAGARGWDHDSRVRSIYILRNPHLVHKRGSLRHQDPGRRRKPAPEITDPK